MKKIGDQWDAIVIGAGVAGGCAAALLADRGWSVLLVERSAWPRESVCGGCLSSAALQTLSEMGMSSVTQGARKTHSVVWHRRRSTFQHEIPEGVAVLRCRLDAAIVERAVHRGAAFLPHCCATLLPAAQGDAFRTIRLQTGEESTDVRAKLVISCDGIGGSFLKHEPWAEWTTAPNTLMGVAATFQADGNECGVGQIHMCMGPHGYVGRVRTDDSTEHLAAALRPSSCRRMGGPLALISEILHSSRLQVPAGLATACLQGAGKLTRYRRILGGHRVLALGDACGYVEPITGEGMKWAAVGALELTQLLPRSINHWHADLPEQWRVRHWQVIGRQQRYCRVIKSIAHHSALAGAGIFAGKLMPGLARWITRAVCEPPRQGAFS